MTHDDVVRKIISSFTDTGYLKSRESSTLEFKESFDVANTAKYAKTMAAFANNRGGYIVFGVKDKPRELVGLKNNKFENLNQENFTETLNSLFSPSLEWDLGILNMRYKTKTESKEIQDKDFYNIIIGWIYVAEADTKPVMAVKQNTGEKISSGDIFYRYRARSEKIKYPEINKIISDRMAKEREKLYKLFETIRKSGTPNLGIVNYTDGRFTTPDGIDIAFDRKLVAQVLKKAKFIKEGHFNEIEGIPVIKVTGNIDLAEEVEVPDLDPDKSHPYIQRNMFEKLNIPRQDLYALIWYFRMKESKKYHIEVTTSKSGKIHKFSDFALRFIEDKLKELNENSQEFDNIRKAYRNRNKLIDSNQ